MVQTQKSIPEAKRTTEKNKMGLIEAVLLMEIYKILDEYIAIWETQDIIGVQA